MNRRAEESATIVVAGDAVPTPIRAGSHLFPAGHLVPFILVTVLFFLRGIPNNLNDVIMEVKAGFSFEEKARTDRSNPKVQEWEKLMWKFQQPLPQARSGEKWLLMERIFRL